MRRIALFPTCVGMNRYSPLLSLSLNSVPHVRGDEPESSRQLRVEQQLFPTCVGMKPYATTMGGLVGNCSPRAWG